MTEEILELCRRASIEQNSSKLMVLVNAITERMDEEERSAKGVQPESAAAAV
jgi:hypothetical protein